METIHDLEKFIQKHNNDPLNDRKIFFLYSYLKDEKGKFRTNLELGITGEENANKIFKTADSDLKTAENWLLKIVFEYIFDLIYEDTSK